MDILKARYTRLGRWWWKLFSTGIIKLCFRKVEVYNQVEVQADKSVLLIGNHIGWWDGFWSMYLNRHYFGKRFHAMMLEKELRKRPFLQHAGAFSIAPGKRSALNSIAYAQELLTIPENMVLLYPQGKIHSLYENEFQFSPGLMRLLAHAPHTQFVMMATFVDFASSPRLGIRVFFQGIKQEEWPETANACAASYQQFYQECLTTHIFLEKK